MFILLEHGDLNVEYYNLKIYDCRCCKLRVFFISEEIRSKSIVDTYIMLQWISLWWQNWQLNFVDWSNDINMTMLILECVQWVDLVWNDYMCMYNTYIILIENRSLHELWFNVMFYVTVKIHFNKNIDDYYKRLCGHESIIVSIFFIFSFVRLNSWWWNQIEILLTFFLFLLYYLFFSSLNITLYT